MHKPNSILYFIEYDYPTKSYVGYCPGMIPVRFESKNKDDVESLVKDGIQIYLKTYPDFFKNARTMRI